MPTERCLVLLKPDGVGKGILEKLLKIYEDDGLWVVGNRFIDPLSRSDAENLYAEHKGKEFFEELISSVCGPVVIIVLEGENAIAIVRSLHGNADPVRAAFGTIRCMFGDNWPHNAVHGSDSEESAQREIEIFFP